MEKLDKRHQNTGRPLGSKDAAPRGPRKQSGFLAVQERFKIATDDQFTDKDIAEVISVAKELAIEKKDPKMIQFLLAKMWENDKAKEVNVNFNNADLREVLGDICEDFENVKVDGEKS